MKALRWYGKEDVRVETVPDPKIQNPGDVIVQITTSAICDSDLHLYDGMMPAMEKGDIIGHEPLGCLPQDFSTFGARRLHRHGGQAALGRRHEQRPHIQDGPDAHAALYETVAK